MQSECCQLRVFTDRMRSSGALAPPVHHKFQTKKRGEPLEMEMEAGTFISHGGLLTTLAYNGPDNNPIPQGYQAKRAGIGLLPQVSINNAK